MTSHSEAPRRLTGLTVSIVDDPDAALRLAVAAHLGLRDGELLHVEPIKRSLDARKRRGGAQRRGAAGSPTDAPAAQWVYSADVFLRGDEGALEAYRKEQASRLDPRAPAFARPGISGQDRPRPIVVGSGPAGLFAALAFVENGLRPILLERGKTLSKRHLDVRAFRRRGELDPDSNLCFGEGGAGTYSDGKLYTRKHHPLVRTVYERLVAYGGTPDILVAAHPHIGTNKLYAILDGIRDEILARGGEIRFEAKVTDLVIEERVQGRRAVGVVLSTGEELRGFPTVLATGHSARDIYGMLHAHNVPLEQKAFAIGARVEHPQALVDEIQLGAARHLPHVEPAEYFLACQVGGRGVYSFCMCPGGYVIPTPTEPGHLNVNGMSNSNRGGAFANAALVVTVEPGDFYVQTPGDLQMHGVLAGLAFQREWERRAFEAGGSTYRAPAQRLTDLVLGRESASLPERTSYRPGVVAGDMAAVLPRHVVGALAQAVPELDRRRMRGYHTADAIIIGVETTTSSPLRVVRDDCRQSPGIEGLYPTGEGAGYSGGIVSSAIDGIESAWAAIEAHAGARALREMS